MCVNILCHYPFYLHLNLLRGSDEFTIKTVLMVEASVCCHKNYRFLIGEADRDIESARHIDYKLALNIMHVVMILHMKLVFSMKGIMHDIKCM